MAKAPKGKYLLVIGIHSGTLTSRDTEQPRVVDSPQEARRQAVQARAGYKQLGCKIWFINMYDDQGKLTVLDYGEPYR